MIDYTLHYEIVCPVPCRLAEMNIWWLMKPRAMCHSKESSPQLLIVDIEDHNVFCHSWRVYQGGRRDQFFLKTCYIEDKGTLADQQMGTVLWSWIKPRSMCGKQESSSLPAVKYRLLLWKAQRYICATVVACY